MKYQVFMATTVSYPLTVEADTEEEAVRLAESEGLPTLVFVDHRYPDVGEWEAAEVVELDPSSENAHDRP